MATAKPQLKDTAYPRIIPDVERCLDEYIQAQVATAGQVHPDYGRLWSAISAVNRSGGKRMRPYLVLVAYLGSGGVDYEGMVKVAAATELLHISMLMHDDIIDRDLMRHGQPNIAGRYQEVYGKMATGTAGDDKAGANHMAMSAALLAGDLVLSGAYQLIAESELPPVERVVATRLLGEAMFAVVAGELLETEATLAPMEQADVVRLAELKTASYSFVVPLKIGATMAGADAKAIAGLSTYGEALGVAFQLADDLLGLFGDEAETGKSAQSDVEEGKRNYLMQQLWRRCSERERQWLGTVSGHGTIAAADIERVRDLAVRCGARGATEAAMQEYAARAREALAGLPLSTEAQVVLDGLVDRVTRRRY